MCIIVVFGTRTWDYTVVERAVGPSTSCEPSNADLQYALASLSFSVGVCEGRSHIDTVHQAKPHTPYAPHTDGHAHPHACAHAVSAHIGHSVSHACRRASQSAMASRVTVDSCTEYRRGHKAVVYVPIRTGHGSGHATLRRACSLTSDDTLIENVHRERGCGRQ